MELDVLEFFSVALKWIRTFVCLHEDHESVLLHLLHLCRPSNSVNVYRRRR